VLAERVQAEHEGKHCKQRERRPRLVFPIWLSSLHIVAMVKTPKQFLQLLRDTLVDNVRVHSAQLLADIELNLGGEPYVAGFDIVLRSHRICQPPGRRLDTRAAAIGVACQT
jgi:hypothetical protein